MAPLSKQRQRTNVSHNASSFKERKYIVKGQKLSEDQDDIASDSTASPATESLCGSTPDSDQDWRSATTKGSPPNSPEASRTSLKSLQDKAKMFVPTDVPAMMMLPPPPCMIPTPGKDFVAGVIAGTFGAELWNLNMMDYMSYSGEWQTGVEITIPALPASMCHLVTSADAQAIQTAQQENLSKAIQSLTRAFEGLKPTICMQPSDSASSICVEFCAADKTRLCQEFSHFGSCPRGDTCRWAHAMVETFMINLFLAPLAQWNCNTQTQPPLHSVQTPQGTPSEPQTAGRWQPSRPPMASAEKAQCATKSTDNAPVSDNVKVEPRKVEPMKPLAADVRPKNPHLASRKKWCDIQEDDDDEADCLVFA